MKFSFEVFKKDSKSLARVGIIDTAHGKIDTPAFSPVATKGTVKALSPNDLKEAGCQVVLGNTYHLYLQPGVEVIKKFGGLGAFMGWNGPTITDSGGYQVSFLWNGNKDDRNKDNKKQSYGKVTKITDRGAFFSSYIDGSKHLITPEKSIEIQHILGADMIMAFDQPLGSDFLQEEKKEAFGRTLKWEERSFVEWKRLGSTQALFGIIQGETDRTLRRESLKFLLGLGFPGLAIGGESIGSDPKITAKALDTVADLLPEDKPLHALGLGGGPEGIFTGIERGVDIFDNSSVTRMARTGLTFIYPEDGGKPSNKFRLDINKSKFREDKSPISKICNCFSCQNFSRAYIRHLLVANEVLGLRLTSIHNVAYINNLMALIRDAIYNNDFNQLKHSWLK